MFCYRFSSQVYHLVVDLMFLFLALFRFLERLYNDRLIFLPLPLLIRLVSAFAVDLWRSLSFIVWWERFSTPFASNCLLIRNLLSFSLRCWVCGWFSILLIQIQVLIFRRLIFRHRFSRNQQRYYLIILCFQSSLLFWSLSCSNHGDSLFVCHSDEYGCRWFRKIKPRKFFRFSIRVHKGETQWSIFSYSCRHACIFISLICALCIFGRVSRRKTPKFKNWSKARLLGLECFLFYSILRGKKGIGRGYPHMVVLYI